MYKHGKFRSSLGPKVSFKPAQMPEYSHVKSDWSLSALMSSKGAFTIWSSNPESAFGPKCIRLHFMHFNSHHRAVSANIDWIPPRRNQPGSRSIPLRPCSEPSSQPAGPDQAWAGVRHPRQAHGVGARSVAPAAPLCGPTAFAVHRWAMQTQLQKAASHPKGCSFPSPDTLRLRNQCHNEIYWGFQTDHSSMCNTRLGVITPSDTKRGCPPRKPAQVWPFIRDLDSSRLPCFGSQASHSLRRQTNGRLRKRP